MTAQQMIEDSVRTNATVHAMWSEQVETDLLAWCDDSANSGTIVEYWGTTDDGDEWRVHLSGPPSSAVIV